MFLLSLLSKFKNSYLATDLRFCFDRGSRTPIFFEHVIKNHLQNIILVVHSFQLSAQFRVFVMSELLAINTNTVNNDSMCVLVSETDPEVKFVLLDKEPLTLGRSPQTKIVNQRMSKNQSKLLTLPPPFVTDISSSVFLNDNIIPVENHVKYLGIYLGKRFTWATCVKPLY